MADEITVDGGFSNTAASPNTIAGGSFNNTAASANTVEGGSFSSTPPTAAALAEPSWSNNAPAGTPVIAQPIQDIAGGQVSVESFGGSLLSPPEPLTGYLQQGDRVVDLYMADDFIGNAQTAGVDEFTALFRIASSDGGAVYWADSPVSITPPNGVDFAYRFFNLRAAGTDSVDNSQSATGSNPVPIAPGLVDGFTGTAASGNSVADTEFNNAPPTAVVLPGESSAAAPVVPPEQPVAVDHTVDLTNDQNYRIMVGSRAAPVLIELPDPAGQNQWFEIIDASLQAATYPVAVDPGTATIDGASGTIVLNKNGQVLELINTASGWKIL